MALGDGTDDAALNAAWIEFCDRLKAAGERVFKDPNSASGLQRADAFRFLTQNLGQAFDLALETKDTRYPAIHTFCNPTASSAATAPTSSISRRGSTASRPTASPGTAAPHGFSTSPCKARGRRRPGPFACTSRSATFRRRTCSAQQLADRSRTAASSSTSAGSERGPNWLPTTPAHASCSSARASTRWDERPARMRIERVDMDAPKPLPTPADDRGDGLGG